MRIDVAQWPQLSEAQKGKKLFVNYTLEDNETQFLRDLGWEPTDIRVFDTTDLKARQAVVLAWLEGLRQGTLEPPPKLMEFLDLEARICGLSTGKVMPEDSKKLDQRTVDAALDFQSTRAFKSVGENPMEKYKKVNVAVRVEPIVAQTVPK